MLSLLCAMCNICMYANEPKRTTHTRSHKPTWGRISCNRTKGAARDGPAHSFSTQTRTHLWVLFSHLSQLSNITHNPSSSLSLPLTNRRQPPSSKFIGFGSFLETVSALCFVTCYCDSCFDMMVRVVDMIDILASRPTYRLNDSVHEIVLL